METVQVPARQEQKNSTQPEGESPMQAENKDFIQTGNEESARADIAKPTQEEPALSEQTDVPQQKRKGVSHADIIKLIGLIVFAGIIALVCVFLWPRIGGLFEEGGVTNLVAEIQGAGAAGVAVMMGMQLLQIIVAFIPGEVVQVAAGMVYGPWLGALLIIVGCVISSALIFGLVRWLGAPFVQGMVSTKFSDKFEAFEKSGKLDITVFILFLIPGLPKDTFAYLVPLTTMPMGRYLALSNIGRIPGVLVSTYAAASIVEGDIVTSIVLFSIAAAIAVVGIIFSEKIIAFFEKRSKKKKDLLG